ncbi:hypothetical protein [Agarivorans sp. Toyoura001]|uniref:hypothetical protein n=1 Tax=Agarivorans sp. Toyoura001 TaxID=2283141 RepID=UPI0010F446FC|nr:hypothetical protein [Agarivorans sp. Toyoura001]
MLRTLLYRILFPFIIVLLVMILAILQMQKVTLAKFYDKELSVSDYLNWFSTHPANTVDVLTVLKAKQPNHHGGTTKDWCPSVSSDDGFVHISYLDEQPVCCMLGKGQRYVYYKENEQEITLLCGRWPRTEVVSVNKKGMRAVQSYRSANPIPQP